MGTTLFDQMVAAAEADAKQRADQAQAELERWESDALTLAEKIIGAEMWAALGGNIDLPVEVKKSSGRDVWFTVNGLNVEGAPARFIGYLSGNRSDRPHLEVVVQDPKYNASTRTLETLVFGTDGPSSVDWGRFIATVRARFEKWGVDMAEEEQKRLDSQFWNDAYGLRNAYALDDEAAAILQADRLTLTWPDRREHIAKLLEQARQAVIDRDERRAESARRAEEHEERLNKANAERAAWNAAKLEEIKRLVSVWQDFTAYRITSAAAVTGDEGPMIETETFYSLTPEPNADGFWVTYHHGRRREIKLLTVTKVERVLVTWDGDARLMCARVSTDFDDVGYVMPTEEGVK